MADRTFGPYPPLAIVGGGELSGLYGVAGGLTDAQGTGLQHCFAGDYRHDLIHTATTLLRYPDGTVAYGNRVDDGRSHPRHRRPLRAFNRDGYAFGTTFDATPGAGPAAGAGAGVPTGPTAEPGARARPAPGAAPQPGAGAPGPTRTEVVCASAPGCITFACTITGPFEGDILAHLVFRPYPGAACRLTPQGAVWEGPAGKRLTVTVEGEAPLHALTADSPSGFLYRTVQLLQRREPSPDTLTADQPIGLAIGRPVTVPAGESLTFRWHLHLYGTAPGDPGPFWEDWYRQGAPIPTDDPALAQLYRANLAALRGAVMNGFVPADMTGQYFADGAPSYYARDALMIARALLLSGHHPEFAAIVRYLADRPVKRGGEFCQRYDAAGSPAEGQHNGVPHQLDSQGYFAWNVIEYWHRTGDWLVPFDKVVATLDALSDCVGPQGMVGPEGGVNEGVYGPAYITSTNMVLYGGLTAGMEAARHLGHHEAAERWERLRARIGAGIESAWDEELGRYSYGYVTYDDRPVRQYDAPQYFGPLYGYPVTERMRQTDRFLRAHAAFYGDGIGYSEQAYHHGPWVFNTAACAEFQALTGNAEQYRAKLNWLMAHSNQYGLMPEAIDADDADRCFVNPLVWGCAEVVAAIAIAAETARGGDADG